MKRRDRRLLGAMIQTLLAYPDYPFDWGRIGYRQVTANCDRCHPANPTLRDVFVRRNRPFIDLVRPRSDKGRKVWVYVQFTDKHDVEHRLEKLLRKKASGSACCVPVWLRHVARHGSPSMLPNLTW